jgi:hypothetical protein
MGLANPMPESTLSPVRKFGFGLKIILDRDEHSVYIQVIHHQPNLCPSFGRKMIINLKKRKEVPQMTRRMVNQVIILWTNRRH